MSSNKEEQFIIKGLSGKRVLSGSIPVRGAKNAALKALAASLLFKDEVTLKNVPDIEDIKRTIELLEILGVSITRRGKDTYYLKIPSQIGTHLPEKIANQLRSSIVYTGPLLARVGRVSFSLPGGCVLGARPIDIFLKGFEEMGAIMKKEKMGYVIEAPKGGLRGATIFLKKPSVTATESLMMAGVLARGTTLIRNAALEPEILALAQFLNANGARIKGAGTPEISIQGGALLKGKKPFTTPPDRIEAGSFLILGALSARDLLITHCDPTHLDSLINELRAAGVYIEVGKNTIRVKATSTKKLFKAHDIKTHEYPGFPTDLQAPITVFLTQASGVALVHETIFEDRFRYLDALSKMGARIKVCDPHRIIVYGPAPLSGSTLRSPDLRAGLAYIIAAIVADGDSVIHNVYTIDRGYERIEERLQAIGVEIKRVGS